MVLPDAGPGWGVGVAAGASARAGRDGASAGRGGRRTLDGSAPAATFTTRVRAHLLVLDAKWVRRGVGVGPAFMSKEISAAHDT